MNKVNPTSLRGILNNYIINAVSKQLPDNHVLIDTFWLTVKDPVLAKLDNSKIAVCYSGLDWENTGCIEDRMAAHRLINARSSKQIHIGNTNNEYFFSFWTEFIRQNPKYFLDNVYIQPPKLEKLFLSYNNTRRDHRVFLLDQIDSQGLDGVGIISRPGSARMAQIVEQFDENDRELQNVDCYSLGEPEIWSKFLINVVTESTTHSNLFLSEKTWKPIIGMRTFLILGDNNLYTKLKELGFDTFDDLFGTWWESLDWQQRARSIVDILKQYQHTDLNKLYAKLLPRLQYNRENFKSFMIKNHNKICNLGL